MLWQDSRNVGKKYLNPKIIAIHCFGHTLNLDVQDLIRNAKKMKDMYKCAWAFCTTKWTVKDLILWFL